MFVRTLPAICWGLADDLMVGWKPIPLSGAEADTMTLPAAAKEMLRWECRALDTPECYLQGRDMVLLRRGVFGHITMADLVLYQFSMALT